MADQTATKTARVEDAVAARVAAFHARRPMRIWSLVITLYGDAIVPRGGSLWLGTLLKFMALMDVSAGAVRAAMSRLASDGWLERARAGRNAYYHLAASGRRSFEVATRRIYAPGPIDWDGDWQICLIATDDPLLRERHRAELRDLGFAVVAPNIMLRPDPMAPAIPADLSSDIIVFAASASRDMEVIRTMVAQAWSLDDLAAAYRALIGAYEPLRGALCGGGRLTPADAIVARTLMMHDYRRVALHDPLFAPRLLPADWPGGPARQLCGDIYRSLKDASEAWLAAEGRNEAGPLPRPGAEFHQRFGGL